MKNIITTLILTALTTMLFGQLDLLNHQIPNPEEKIIIENHVYLDTLWLLDSSKMYNYEGNNLVLTRLYKVHSRNDAGNVITSFNLSTGNVPFPEFENSYYDSIIYFNSQDIKEHTTKVWNNAEEKWIDCNYRRYQLPDLPELLINKKFSNNTNEFVSGNSETYINSNGRVDTVYFKWLHTTSGNWKISSADAYSYDDQSNMVSQTVLYIDNDILVPSGKFVSYYESGNVVEAYLYSYDKPTNTWVFDSKGIYIYNTNWLPDTTIINKWNTETLSWEDYRITYYSYDNQNRLIDLLQLKFDDATQQYQNWKQTTVVYENGNETRTEKEWRSIGNDSYIADITFTSYFAEDVIDTIIYYTWSFSTYDTTKMIVNKIDNHMNITESSTFAYGLSGWYHRSKDLYYWSPFINSDISEHTVYTLKTYPNPATTYVNISLHDNNNLTNCKISIFSISGNKVDEVTMNNGHTVWDCSGVKPGIYFYSTVVEGRRYAGKIIVK